MEFEDIARLVNQVALERKGRPLKDVERLVFKGAWENQTYSSMAQQAVGYSEDYLKKDVGPKLWHLLSELVGADYQDVKITKRNIQNVLQTWAGQFSQVWADLEEVITEPALVSPPLEEPRSLPHSVRATPPVDSADLWGRAADLQTLTTWVDVDCCRFIVLWGLPGVGKTTLAAQILGQVTKSGGIGGYLALSAAMQAEDIINALGHWVGQGKGSQSPSFDWILDQLEQRRYLLVLDQLETLFDPQQLAGTFAPAAAEIQQLLQRLATQPHRSCVVVLSQEKPMVLSQWLGSRVREYALQDFSPEEIRSGLQPQGIAAVQDHDWVALTQCYGGNPLLLRNLLTTLHDVYQGQLKTFLAQPPMAIPDPVAHRLGAVLARLTPDEQTLLYWLAIAHEPLTLDAWGDRLNPHPSAPVVQSLLGRSLGEIIPVPAPPTAQGERPTRESATTALTLTPLVRSLALTHLLDRLKQELTQGHLFWFLRLPLITMTAKETIQAQQRQALLQPLAAHLQRQFSSETTLRQQLAHIHHTLRQTQAGKPGYGAGNLLQIYRHLGIGLSGADFSNLAIWYADLRQSNLQGASFSQAHFHATAFATALGRSPVAAFAPAQRVAATSPLASSATLLATGDHEGRLLLWDSRQGRLLRVLDEGQSPAIRALVFSPDGHTLAVGTETGQIWLWPLGTHGQAEALGDHPAAVCALAFSPDGRHLASGDDQGCLRLWDLASGQRQHQRLNHQGSIHTLAFNAKGDHLISSGDDQKTCLWNLNGREMTEQTTFQARSTASIRTAGFLPDPTDPTVPAIAFAAGYDEHCLTLWDIEAGRPCWILPADVQALPAMAISPNGRYLVCSRQDFSVVLWDIPRRTARYTLPPLTAPVWLLAFSRDSRYLLTGSDYALRLWQAKTGAGLRSWLSQAHPVCALAFTAVGQTLLTGHTDYGLRRWITQAHTQPLPQALNGHTAAIQAVAVSPAGQWLASAAADQTLRLWQANTGQHIVIATAATLLSFSPDGRHLASASPDSVITLWDTATGQPRQILGGLSSLPSALAFSDDGEWLVCGSRDGSLQRYYLGGMSSDSAPNPAQPEPEPLRIDHSASGLATPRGPLAHQRQIHSLALSRDGSYLASASYDGTVCWWDLVANQCLGTWQHPHGQWIHGVLFDPDDSPLAISSHATEVEVWEIATQTHRATLKGHSHDIWGVAISPDRSHIATASQDSEIRLWQMTLGRCQHVLHPDRPYEGVNIRGADGLSTSEIAMLKSLGATVNY